MYGKRHRVWLIATIMAGAVFQASASNIVVDPGFENGTPSSYTGDIGDGWVVTAGTAAICDNSGGGCGNAGVAHTGTQMAFLDWSDTFDTLTQTLSTAIGETYTISWFVAGTQPNFLEVTFGGSILFNGTSPTNDVDSPNDYVRYTFNSTATSASTVLAFSGQRTARGEILLDDVSVTPTPEPSALALTSLCLVVMALRHVVRKPNKSEA